MIRWMLRLVGLRIVYVCEWGVYSHRYDATDHAMGRPIHGGMAVAPPWAKLRLRTFA